MLLQKRLREPGARKGFTLVELIVVVLIIGILASIAVIAFNMRTVLVMLQLKLTSPVTDTSPCTTAHGEQASTMAYQVFVAATVFALP